jgi:hypothetical protein
MTARSAWGIFILIRITIESVVRHDATLLRQSRYRQGLYKDISKMRRAGTDFDDDACGRDDELRSLLYNERANSRRQDLNFDVKVTAIEAAETH